MQITKTLCDRDFANGGKEVTEGVTTVTFSLGRRQFEADLCPACQEALNKAMEPFINDGRRSGLAPKQVVIRTPQRATGGDEEGQFKCPEKDCDRSFSTNQGLSMHKRRSHTGELAGNPNSKKEKVSA